MNSTLIVTTLAMALSAGQAIAESEGNGDPFAFRAEAQVTSGRPFVTETMADQYPQLTGETTRPSTLAQLDPAPGRETPVQTAASLPRGFGDGSPLHAQMRNTNRYWAVQEQVPRYLEAGTSRPGS